MHEEIFQLGEAREVDLQLRIAPAGVLAHGTTAKAVRCARHLLRTALLFDHLADQSQEPACLRWQLIERAAEDLVGEAVGECDVIEGHLDLSQGLHPGPRMDPSFTPPQQCHHPDPYPALPLHPPPPPTL